MRKPQEKGKKNRTFLLTVFAVRTSLLLVSPVYLGGALNQILVYGHVFSFWL